MESNGNTLATCRSYKEYHDKKKEEEKLIRKNKSVHNDRHQKLQTGQRGNRAMSGGTSLSITWCLKIISKFEIQRQDSADKKTKQNRNMSLDPYKCSERVTGYE